MSRTGAACRHRFNFCHALSPTFSFALIPFSLGITILVTVSPCRAQKQPTPSSPPSVAWKGIPKPSPKDYLSPDRCEDCHRPEYLEFEKTVHAHLAIPKQKYVTGCGMCHGPDRVHTEAEEAARGNDAKMAAAAKLIFSFRTANPHDAAAHCLACHTTSEHQQFFSESAHALHGVACNSCHTMHLVEAAVNPEQVGLAFTQAEYYSVPQLPVENQWLHDGMLKQAQPELCYQCHATIQANFALPFHHRVPEGLMKCTDCHTPHGTITAAHQLNQPNWQACVKCHIEVGGPFVYEHAAVKIVGCVGCHNPHGSVNHFMLVRRETRFLCLQCHTGFHGQTRVPHGPATTFENEGDCTRCHIAIHGSNFDPDLVH